MRRSLILCSVALLVLCALGQALAWQPYTTGSGLTSVISPPESNNGTDLKGRYPAVWGLPFYRCYVNAAVGTTHYMYFPVNQTTGRNVMGLGAHVLCYSGAGATLTWFPWPDIADSVQVTLDSDITKRQSEFWYKGPLWGVRLGDDSGTSSVVLEIW